MFEELKEKLDAVNVELEESQKAMKAKVSESFKEATATFFQAVPEIAFVQWKQYAPYFNDDDACEFERYGSIYVLANEFLREPVEDEDDTEDRVIYEHWGDEVELQATTLTDTRFNEIKEACKSFESILKTIDDSFFEDAFGSNSEVTVTPKKVISERYEDHD